jgi:hypothetical protein
MGNAQGKDADGKELWSARVDNRYVVAPGSFHPTSGRQYEILRNKEIVPAPDWLVQWCIQNKKTEIKTGNAILDNEEIIREGGRNNALTSILGEARQKLRMDADQLYNYGLDVNRKRVQPPLPDSEVRTIADSIGKYPIKEQSTLVLGTPPASPVVVLEPVVIPAKPYPVFPEWVMHGTSIYEGLVKPVCATNSRYPEFMFMPAMVLTLNYLALKVKVEKRDKMIPSFYMVSIGRKGRVIKSSSVEDAIEYLSAAGIVKDSSGVRNAEGKSLVWTAGSSEGLGLDMVRTNCKNAVLFYDELSNLTKKASIEGSTLKSNLLTMYESGQFSNAVKSRKEMFSFPPRSYCTSLIACTTDKNFHAQWSNMSGGSSGLDERFFFLYQPEILSELIPYNYVNTVEGSVKTRQLIEKAIAQQVYKFSDQTVLDNVINELGNRTHHRLEKMALFFAVDLGKDEIDDSCIDRALAVARYELKVKKYLASFETENKEAALQAEIIRLMQRSGGVVTSRQLYAALHPERYGTFLWSRAYHGLLSGGWAVETGDGTKGSPKQLILTKQPEEDE